MYRPESAASEDALGSPARRAATGEDASKKMQSTGTAARQLGKGLHLKGKPDSMRMTVVRMRRPAHHLFHRHHAAVERLAADVLELNG